MQFDIRRLDIYRKIPKDLTQPTLAGACISVCSILFIIYLLAAEFYAFISPEIVSELFVDDPTTHSASINVSVSVTIFNTKCEFLGLDIQDDLGRHEVGFIKDTHKMPLPPNEVGCRFKASFQVKKVPGNFHISTHSSKKQPDKPDMRHLIHYVRFGDQVQAKYLAGSFDPLENKSKNETAQNSHDYFIKVVPTIYTDLSGDESYPYQYTYAHREQVQYGHGHRVMPAIWFRYDLTPITVKYVEKRPPIYTFLTMMCAIIGGTFTVAGIIDSLFFTATAIFKKLELGKLS